MIDMTDERATFWMNRALELAERGRGAVEPNPLVGAVVVRDDKIIAEGWHEKYGEAHAEVHALTRAGEGARGATLIVTLEPCCHHGKTPPCTDAIVRAGITRVVAAMQDPFSKVTGEGFRQLREAGVTVEVGLEEAQAKRLNAPYLKLLAQGQPYVHAKWAMSLDGKIATRTGNSKWISNEASRRRVHALRGRMDGILIGIATALADDPLLTARPAGPRTATRIILDTSARLPVDARLARTAKTIPTLIVCSTAASPPQVKKLQEAGCEVLLLEPRGGRLRLTALLEELGRRRLTNLLVEGGSDVLGSFLDKGAIDEVHIDIAPLLIGGAQAKSCIGGLGVEAVAQALRLQDWRIDTNDGDIHVHGWVNR
jgi:diaminohydroxyphosphoribosylaminopyrimidine deaminase/5-amino-6-(5-phosphoribosylamino)uracil reductase